MSNSDKYVISEFYAFEADSNLIKEAEEKNKPIIMKGILQKANTENRNGRVYPLEILKREAKPNTQLSHVVEGENKTTKLSDHDYLVMDQHGYKLDNGEYDVKRYEREILKDLKVIKLGRREE